MKLISTKEAAEILNTSKSAISRLVKSGKIKPHSLGARGAWKFRKKDVVALSKSRRVAKKSTAGAEHSASLDVEKTEFGLRYTFTSGDITVYLVEAEYKKLLRMYSNWDGAPANRDQVCAEFRLTRPELHVVLTAAGVTHTHPPFSEEEMRTRPFAELAEESLATVKQRLYRKVSRDREAETAKAAAKWWAFEENAQAFAEALVGKNFTFEPLEIIPLEGLDSDRLAILFPTDLHYGKYAQPGEPGQYNRDMSRRRLLSHVATVLRHAKKAGVGTIAYYPGSDFYNADNMQGMTTRGTPQDNDGHMAEIAPEGLQLQFEVLELVRSGGFRTIVKACPGNHDDILTRMTIAAMAWAYRDTEDVTVDSGASKYGFLQWGKTLIMDTHGDGKHSTTDLAQVMSTQRPRLWADCPYRYAIRGNLHHVLDQEGAGIRNILFPSLGGSDAYHKKMYPVAPRPMIRLPVFTKDTGLISIYESAVPWSEDDSCWSLT